MSDTITFYIKNINNILIKTLLISRNIKTKNELLQYLIDIDFLHNNNYDLYHGKKPIEDIIPDNVFESSLLLVEKN